MTIRRSHQISAQDIGQLPNIPLNECTSFDIESDPNPVALESLGEYAHWQDAAGEEFDSQTSTEKEQQLLTDTSILTGISNKLPPLPSLYAQMNIRRKGGLKQHPSITGRRGGRIPSSNPIRFRSKKINVKRINPFDPDTWYTSQRVRYAS